MQSIEQLQRLLNTQRLTLAIVDQTQRPIYIQPSYIAKNYSMSRGTVHQRLKEMRSIAKYEKSFLQAGERKPLVKLVDFESYLRELGKL